MENNGTSVGLTNSSSEKEQLTKATIGQGNIVIGGSAATEEQLAAINRDVNQTQLITKDVITGALDGDFKIDNRMLNMGGGWSSIAGDIVNLPGNLITSAAGAIDGTKNIGLAGYAIGDTLIRGLSGELKICATGAKLKNKS